MEPQRRLITLGIPSGHQHGEGRLPLTPEGAAQLVEQGVGILIESGAGTPIHYSDAAYERAGARIAGRAETLRCDIVASTAPLLPSEAHTLKRGALLLTLSSAVIGHELTAHALLRAGVNTLAADLISDGGHRIVADILHEIDGCASIAIASAMLTDPIHGKGILLGGVTGIVPCEVVVIGSGMGAIAAAHNALGLGATVRMFDNDLYSLRKAGRVLNHRAISSSLHPKVLRSALQSADVVVVTPTKEQFMAPADGAEQLKRRAIVFDLTARPGYAFGGLRPIDLSAGQGNELTAASERACYFNVGCRVPRTAAMALSNALVGNFAAIYQAQEGSLGAMPQSLRGALLTFWGRCVNRTLARQCGVGCIDINILSSGLQ